MLLLTSTVLDRESCDFVIANLEVILKYKIDSEGVENKINIDEFTASFLNIKENDVCEFILKTGRVFLAGASLKEKVKKRKRARRGK